jgi:hypothetical protein
MATVNSYIIEISDSRKGPWVRFLPYPETPGYEKANHAAVHAQSSWLIRPDRFYRVVKEGSTRAVHVWTKTP